MTRPIHPQPIVVWQHRLRHPLGISHAVLACVLIALVWQLGTRCGLPEPLAALLCLAVGGVGGWASLRAFRRVHHLRLSSKGLERASRFGRWEVVADPQATIPPRPARKHVSAPIAIGLAIVLLAVGAAHGLWPMLKLIVWIGLLASADGIRGTPWRVRVGQGADAFELDLQAWRDPDILAHDLEHAPWTFVSPPAPELLETR